MHASTTVIQNRLSAEWPAGSPADQPAIVGAATVEPVFDRAGLVCAWMLPDRLVGRAGGTQAWLVDGALYSRVGTHIGILRSGLFSGTDGLVSGFLSCAVGPPSLPPQESTPPAPSSVPPALRPRWKPRHVSAAPSEEWSTYGWSGFLIATGRTGVPPWRGRPRFPAGTGR
ncbi:MAG: hypothetical protein JWQ92_3208 [Amnibacterium sp.]|nr:hypothetical protein [Amnibacterium sp.]